MHKLLVPIDGSEPAMRALNHAIGLAKQNGPNQIHVITVMPEPLLYGEIEVYVPAQQMEEMQRSRGAEILKEATDLLDRAGVAYTSEVAIGETASVICGRADELGCNGIVMGTRGMGPVGNLVIGSVATKVVHLTRLPVTLVK